MEESSKPYVGLDVHKDSTVSALARAGRDLSRNRSEGSRFHAVAAPRGLN